TFSPVSSRPLRVRADISQLIRLSSGQTLLGRPRRRGGSRSISRPSDRSTEPGSGLGPFGSRSLRQEHRRHTLRPFPPRKQSGLEPLVSSACCTVAAASTYIRSSANGSYQNPAYSRQLGSKMDGTRLSYG